MVVGRAERGHQSGLRAIRDPVEDVHLIAALDAEQRRQHADRPGPGDQRDLTRLRGAGADRLDLLPRLSHDAAWLGQHPEVAE